eukprot:UN30475
MFDDFGKGAAKTMKSPAFMKLSQEETSPDSINTENDNIPQSTQKCENLNFKNMTIFILINICVLSLISVMYFKNESVKKENKKKICRK